MAQNTVIWTNEHFPSATIEIREDVIVGDPTANSILATPLLLRDEPFSLTSDGIDGFYWVRLDPPSDGVYIHRPCFGNGDTFNESV